MRISRCALQLNQAVSSATPSYISVYRVRFKFVAFVQLRCSSSSSFRRLAVIALLRAYVPAFAFFAASFIPQWTVFACDRVVRLGAEAWTLRFPYWSGYCRHATSCYAQSLFRSPLAANLRHVLHMLTAATTTYSFTGLHCCTYVCMSYSDGSADGCVLADLYSTMQGAYKMQHNIHVTGCIPGV